MIIEAIQEALISYIKNHKGKFFTITDNKSMLDQLREMKIQHENYRFLSWGDTGLKRLKFLLSKLEVWKQQHLKDGQAFREFCLLYSSHKEPPLGLGNSNNLRKELCFLLAHNLFNETMITDEERTNARIRLTQIVGTEDPQPIEPTEEAVIESILFDKTEKLILKQVNDKKSRLAFLFGFHARLGNQSSLRTYYEDLIFEKNLVPEIFDYSDIGFTKFMLS